MTALFILAVTLTIGISALCSVLEAMILSTTVAEIESLKQKHPAAGKLLEKFKTEMEETSSAILSLNTVANTSGCSAIAFIAAMAFKELDPVHISIALTLAVLVFSEIIPKNLGVVYRKSLQPYLVYPLWVICFVMTPLSKLCKITIRMIVSEQEEDEESAKEKSEEEIILLAEKSAKDGNLSLKEKDIINNALQLDDIEIRDLMTPRTVVTALDEKLTVEEVCNDFRNIPFARIPVYKENIDNVIGIVRRRDLLTAKANDEDNKTVGELTTDAVFVPEHGKLADALQVFLKKQQQLGIVVDEFGSIAGVISMEDIIEHIIGQEIFEKDDPAIDMRELARRKQLATKKRLSRKINIASIK
jgi:CBS domain containing-hemolysin-like protein